MDPGRIKEELPNVNIQSLIIEGSGAGDKKVAAGNHVLGRGTEAQAEVYIPERILQEVLKASFIYLFIHSSFVHSFVHSFIHSFTYLLTYFFLF